MLFRKVISALALLLVVGGWTHGVVTAPAFTKLGALASGLLRRFGSRRATLRNGRVPFLMRMDGLT